MGKRGDLMKTSIRIICLFFIAGLIGACASGPSVKLDEAGTELAKKNFKLYILEPYATAYNPIPDKYEQIAYLSASSGVLSRKAHSGSGRSFMIADLIDQAIKLGANGLILSEGPEKVKTSEDYVTYTQRGIAILVP